MTTLINMISSTATAKPDKVAVIFEDREITYSELEGRANQLAHRLIGLGVKPGVLVGLCMERSIDMMVALLGVLKAGGTYIPLDPAYPTDRIVYMLEDSAAAVVLTQESLREAIPFGNATCLCLDSEWAVISEEDQNDPSVEVGADDLAYIIYTSGSTGKPKGVEIPHGALANFMISMSREPGLTQEDRLLAVTTLSFDIAGLELYLPLVVGAQVVLASRSMAGDGAQLAREIASRKITAMQATPATWRLLLEANWPGCQSMRIFCGGEALSRDLAEQLIPLCSELWNLYGPTETTIWSTVSRVISGSGSISIGKAIRNTEIQVLDDQMQAVALGTPGELYIGGDGLARGYFNRPDLTAERFIPHPLDNTSGARLYRTGDLVKASADGSLEHLGRVDFQVKVRGFRIELGEIEAALDAQPSVRQAVVIAREDTPGDKRLVAYIIPAEDESPSSRDLRNALAVTLPDYMVPGIYIPMDNFPLTPNGKVDRKSFPAPEPYRPELASEYLAPRDEGEKRLAAIWAEVLRVEKVGVNDNFFELGGDSLKVAQVATRIRNQFGVDMALRSMFENPTVGSLTPVVTSSEKMGATFEELPITEVVRGDYIPLSFSQERVWFLHQLNPQNLAYNFISRIDFNGDFNADAMQAALDEVLRRHESYRTTFPTVDGRPMQVVHPHENYMLPTIDLRGRGTAEQEIAVQEWYGSEFCLRFDLGRLPLVRWHLIRFSEDHSALIHMEHHLVHDGWSFNVFLVELLELYTAYVQGKESPLEELPIQFAEFTTWQRQWMQGAVSDHQLAYWKKIFATIPPILELPYKGSRPAIQSFNGASLRPELPLELCNQLRTLSRSEGSTLFMTMLAGYVALLHRYTGENDIAVGTFFANRRAQESEGLIGMILNNTVIRTALDGNPTARELVGMVRDTVLDAAHHQDVPFDRVVEAVQPRRDLSSNPLFQLMFSFHDEPMPESTVPNLDIKVTPVLSNGSAKFDLGIIGIPHSAQVVGLPQGSDQDGLTMLWEYNTDLFETATIERMIEHYIHMMKDLVANPDQNLSDLEICPSAELQTSLITWNDTGVAYRKEQCLHELIEAQVAKTPDDIAVVFGAETLSYRQLDDRANQLANFLIEEGMERGKLIGICMERSEKMLVSLLAVMKTGGIYVPMDPSFPADRLGFMVEDASIATLITEGDVCDCLESDTVTLIRLDAEAKAIDQKPVSLSKPSGSRPEDLAYIIYTSGSTGRPKGVQISHSAVVNFLESMATTPGIKADDRLFAVTTIAFDIAGLELYLPLITGARVIISSRTTAIDGEELATQLETTGATILQATPTTWQLLLDSGWSGNSSLTALCGGEALPRALAEQLLPKVSCLWNMYGPTETTIWSTVHRVESGVGAVPIGRPINNTSIFVLDRYDNPVPIGVAGELCIGGDGVANGYLNRAELSAEKFIDNPIKSAPQGTIYRTGDLARYRADGTLECLGRTDHQIKLRGYRIELGEIESLLDKIPGITQSVVIAKEYHPGDKRLIAYAVCRGDNILAPKTILSILRENLPDYMVPGVCEILDEMPLTPNGKVDRLSLPEPSGFRKNDRAEHVPARTDLEKQLAKIWESVLSVSPVGIYDDFFEVGGHSILAVRLVSEIEAAIGKRIPIAALLQGRTIEYVASVIADGDDCEVPGTSLVALQPNGDSIPLFMIGSHPRYATIPKHLGSNQPVFQLDMYALQSQRKAQGLKAFTRIEEYADYYLAEIRNVRPAGPYNLGGGCEGAYLAYEIAVRLQQMGEEVRHLVMWIPPPLRQSMGMSLRRFPVWQSLQRLRYIVTGGSLQNMSRQQLKLLLEHEKLEYRILQAICSYQPKTAFEGDIALIRTEYAPFKWKADINQPWVDRATGGAEVHVVRGNHQNWLYEYVDDLAEILKKRLERGTA